MIGGLHETMKHETMQHKHSIFIASTKFCYCSFVANYIRDDWHCIVSHCKIVMFNYIYFPRRFLFANRYTLDQKGEDKSQKLLSHFLPIKP